MTMKFKMKLGGKKLVGGVSENMTRQEKRQYIKKMMNMRNYPDNEVYLSTKEKVVKLVNDMSKTIEVEEHMFSTMVNGYGYSSNKTTLSLPCGSHIRFGSRAKSLDITRVWISPEQQGKGIGTFLMSIVLNSIFNNELTEFPKVILECVGSVGLGQNRQDTPISEQVRFFKKFGFVVDRVDFDGTHHMVLEKELLLDFFMDYLKTNKIIFGG